MSTEQQQTERGAASGWAMFAALAFIGSAMLAGAAFDRGLGAVGAGFTAGAVLELVALIATIARDIVEKATR